jgi:hypothetical protein
MAVHDVAMSATVIFIARQAQHPHIPLARAPEQDTSGRLDMWGTPRRRYSIQKGAGSYSYLTIDHGSPMV